MKLLGAAEIISGSQLEYREQLAAEYTGLVESMDDLTDVTREYNSGVDTLITQFRILLTETLSRVQMVNIPVVFQDSMHFQLLVGCTFLWSQDPGFHRSHRKLYAICVSEAMVYGVTILCLDDHNRLKPNSYCSLWLTYLPGMKSHMDKIVEKRVKAVRKLRQFLVVLDLNMQTTSRGRSRQGVVRHDRGELWTNRRPST